MRPPLFKNIRVIRKHLHYDWLRSTAAEAADHILQELREFSVQYGVGLFDLVSRISLMTSSIPRFRWLDREVTGIRFRNWKDSELRTGPTGRTAHFRYLADHTLDVIQNPVALLERSTVGMR